MTVGTLSQPSSPPRALTPRARRRAWAEPRVRFWWLGALVFFAIACVLGWQQYAEWSNERRLIQSGTPVRARVEQAGGIDLPEKKIQPNEAVELSFDWKGKRQTVNGYLAGRKDFIITGHDVDIRVDPDDPTRWTSQTEPRSLATQLLGPMLLAPVVLLLAAAALWARSRVLKTWQQGAAQLAAVVENHQTSLAPLSRAIRCALQDGQDKRLITVYIPQRLARLEKGDPLWVVFPPQHPQRALAAMVYESKQDNQVKEDDKVKK